MENLQEGSEAWFWMGGILATGLVEITDDPKKLSDGGFWVVSATFEGQNTFAKFDRVERNRDFPITQQWQGLESTWKSSIDRDGYMEFVEQIRSQIEIGEVYQVNACRILSAEFSGASLAPLFARILELNPAPQACYLKLPGLEIASASPELFLEREGNLIKCSPIKGTRRISAGNNTFDSKDESENIMIVDLMRNDFGRICESVEVGALLRQEIHPGLEHLVSDVFGRLKPDIDWKDIFSQILPAGSISGTPKISALKVIKANEPTLRGPYCGSLGWVEGERANLSVAIRLFWRDGGLLKFGSGAGITWSSSAEAEWDETELKADKLISLAGGLREDSWPYGRGIFETLRVEDGEVLLLAEHLERARKSAKDLGISIPSDEVIKNAIGWVKRVRLGRLRLHFGHTFTLSLIPYVEQKGLAKVVTHRLDLALDQTAHKAFPYTRNLELLADVRGRGFDEVLIINSHNELAEGAVSNFVFRIDDLWITPPLSAGVLPGIIRQKMLEAGLAIEGNVSADDLRQVTHAFSLSSLRLAQPVESIDGVVLAQDELSKVWAVKLRQFLVTNSVG
jgi:para-aminobenzoate synthetase component 1